MKNVLNYQVNCSRKLDAQFCLLGNKKDQESGRIVSSKSGKSVAKSLGFQYYYEVSKECKEEFEWIFKKFLHLELQKRRRDSFAAKYNANMAAKKKSETFWHKVKRKPGVVSAAVVNILFLFGIGLFLYFGIESR